MPRTIVRRWRLGELIVAGIYGGFIGLLGVGFYQGTKLFIQQNLGSTYNLQRLLVSFGLLVLGLAIFTVGLVVVLKNRASLQAWSIRTSLLMLGAGIAIAVGVPLAFSMAWELFSWLLYLWVIHNSSF